MNKKESITLLRTSTGGGKDYRVLSTKNTLYVLVNDRLDKAEIQDLISNTPIEVNIKEGQKIN